MLKYFLEVLNKTFSAGVKSYQVFQGLAILTSYTQNLKLKETFPTEYNKVAKSIKTKSLGKLSERLINSKPNDLVQCFEMLRFFKKQTGFLTDRQVKSIQSDLEAFSTSDSKFLPNKKVKKQLNKIRVLFGLKCANIAKPKKVKVAPVDATTATDAPTTPVAPEDKDETTNDETKAENTEESADKPEKKKKNKKRELKPKKNEPVIEE